MKTDQSTEELYECPECGLHYTSESTMQKCAAWCAENKTCNIEITKESEESKKQTQEK